MKFTIPVITLVTVALVIVAWKQQASHTTAPDPGVVVFQGAGVSLVPGDVVTKIRGSGFAGDAPPGVCPPLLLDGKAGVISVLLLPPDRSEPQIAAAGLRANYDANPKSIKDSFRQESITLQNGGQVIHLFYSRRSEVVSPESRSHNYIVKNREGRGVIINYLTNASTDSDAVHQMIRQTLRVE